MNYLITIMSTSRNTSEFLARISNERGLVSKYLIDWEGPINDTELQVH
jgi:hypothetical protein